MSDSVRPHRRQPTRHPRHWDSPGKNTEVGCHFLLQCMKVKSESEVTQSCLTLSDSTDCSLPGSSVHGIFQARVLEWGAIAFPGNQLCVYIYPLPLESSSPPPSQPSKSSQSSRLSSLGHTYSSFPPAICVTQGSIYICQCYFLSSSHPLRPPKYPQVYSLRLWSVSLFLPCK